MLRLDAVQAERGIGKVPQVAGDDNIGPTDNGCGENMPVIRIRQRQGIDQVLVPGDD